jgi:CheY-like chemotaxis protein
MEQPPNRQILVVDDNPTNLKLASDVLEFAGYRVFKARDAEVALVLLEELRPALILMDIALPGMDGLTLTRKLKADPATNQIPIVALTAFAMKGDEQKALAAGCDGYITKPFNTRKLSDQVAQVLQSHDPNIVSMRSRAGLPESRIA